MNKQNVLYIAVLMVCVIRATYATDMDADLIPDVRTFLSKQSAAMACSVSTNGWGYSYDSLLTDLSLWKKSPQVTIDSIGASVEGRAIWMVSVTAQTPIAKQAASFQTDGRHRIVVHARTHPREVQSSYIAREMVRYLTDTTNGVDTILQNFIINIVPMLNPDGVERGCIRVNANDVDLESNWDTLTMEPETNALKLTYLSFMDGVSPIDVALNLHSSVGICERFFYFHHENGTSVEYTQFEKQFIGTVRDYFPGGIAPWDKMMSWTVETKTVYPESFFWLNFGERVMALTFEDINDIDTNCPVAGAFDSTAQALLRGAVEYVTSNPIIAFAGSAPQRPMPAHAEFSSEGIRLVTNSAKGAEWLLLELNGRIARRGTISSGLITWNSSGLRSGRYILQIDLLHGQKTDYLISIVK